MFSLLRRSTKKKPTQEESPKVTHHSAEAITDAPPGCIQRYQTYNERSGDRGQGEQHSAHVDCAKTFRLAEIEEFDDLKDLDGDDDDDDASSNRNGLTEGKTLFEASTNDRYVYFRSSVDDDRECTVEDKVNLARSSAADSTSVSTETTTTNTPSSSSSTRELSEGPVVAARSISSPFTLAEMNVDKINKFSANLATLAVCHDDGHERAEDDRGEWPSTVRDGASMNRRASPNEVAVWQGRISPLAKPKKYTKNHRYANRSIIGVDQHETDQQTSNSASAEDAERAITATTISENSFKNVNIDDTGGADWRIVNSTERANVAAINEVKYRHLGNTKNISKVQKNPEVKRQSRLSLTLGLNLTGARNKTVADVTTNNKNSSGETDYHSSSSKSKGRDQWKHSQLGKTFRNSFLRGRTQSSDNETVYVENLDTLKLVEPQCKSGFSVKNNAFKKSKEFLSDIFMARGRNHNRNRNSHSQQTTTQQQPQQKLAQTQQQKSKPSPLTFVSSPSSKDVRTCVSVNEPSGANHKITLADSLHYYNNNSVTIMRNGENNSASTHLDVISDPLSSSTNSHQITMANNRVKNVSQAAKGEECRLRCNSAEEREERARVTERHRVQRSRSADSRGSVSNNRTIQEWNKIEENSAARRVSTAVTGANSVIREGNAELNGKLINNNNTEQAEENSHCGGIEDDPQEINRNEKAEPVNVPIEEIVEGKCREELKVTEHGDNEAKVNLLNVESVICGVAKITTYPNNTHSNRQVCDLSAQLTSSPVTTHEAPMGQTSAKPSDSAPISCANIPREFRKSVLSEDSASIVHLDDASAFSGDKIHAPVLPKITVVDCSDSVKGSVGASLSNSLEQDIFYDFENEVPSSQESADVKISTVHEDVLQLVNGIDNDEVFHDQDIPATIYQNKWQSRYVHTKLENVPEQEEEEDGDGETESVVDSDDDAREADVATTESADNLDNEFEASQYFNSPDRNALKSTNTSDSNLSTSYPDSGISGIDSHCSSTSPSSYLHGRHQSNSDHESHTMRSSKSGSPIKQHYNNQQQQQQPQHQRLPFVRDGNSTDCDETLLQCDDLDYVAEVQVQTESDPNERLVCIESISLPDVVVESTTGASIANNSATPAASVINVGNGDNGDSQSDSSEQIININGATGNTIGNVHFIPIHVEVSDQAPSKRRSVDDSVLGNGGGINKTFAHMNGLLQKSTIEITEDGSELTYEKVNGHNNSGSDAKEEKLRLELIEQKSRYNAQIGDAQRNLQNLQNKVGEMQAKIDKLEQELSAKAWNVERLQSELNAAQKDDDFVRKRLKLLEDEKTNLRHKYSESEDEFKRKYNELETEYQELEEKYKETKQLASNLQTQLATAQSEAEQWRKEVEQIRIELEEQMRILRNALENSEAERKICQDKWQKEFEMLRTQNRDREETLMTDCEWQLRQMRKQCKDKTDKVLREQQLAEEKAELLESELEERKQEVADLKVYQAEVKSLRGVVAEQELSIQTLMLQIENIKVELQTANTNLEEQINAVKTIKYQCDNALCDKEREVVHRINDVRNQAALFWEDKLYTEMTRLKTELESVYVVERRESLDKLQAEHIEELRALTTRYTANEDELRTEFNELQERFDRKSEDFLEMRDKSDNALLQMRMHLDRADREYQNAMCREEERRETLEANLRKEFDAEKEEMEENFRERLSQVKDEFAKELQDTTQEMRQKHQKQLEKQKACLQAEKEEALQELTEKYRKKLAAAEEQIKDIDLRHLHDLNDLKAAYDTEKAAMDKRDISNTNEIEQLHRKCRCLTNLFEEMRLRYERRDPRPEDLREIAELRSRCESQERDLFELTDRLREMQIQMSATQTANAETANRQTMKIVKPVKKPPPKTLPTNCDVIYEDENEERESSPPASRTTPAKEEENDEDTDDDGGVDENKDDDETVETAEKVVNGLRIGKAHSSMITNGKERGQKNSDTINEYDESHMITAV